MSALNNHIYCNHGSELFTKKPQEAPLEPIAAKELENTSPNSNSVEFSTKSFTLHMKIIPKASFGNSYALIDSNLLKCLLTFIENLNCTQRQVFFCTFQCNAKYAQAGSTL